MEAGYLNQYFKAVAVKKLVPGETDISVSNQHEYNGVALLKNLFGTAGRKVVIPTQFLYLTDEDDAIECTGELTWYDARFHHPTRTEWRLYYPTNEVTTSALTGDSLFICLKKDDSVLEIIVKKDSVIENQLYWLFDIKPDDKSNRFIAKTDLNDQPSDRVAFTAKMILQKLGIEDIEEKEDYTDILVDRFGESFPTTKAFSEFARSMVESDPISDPDGTLIRWLDREEVLFRCMERHVIQKRLRDGFMLDDTVDVDSFIKFSLSVNNRRKSRAGFSFENHLRAIFKEHNIRFTHTPVTENNAKPDFIFPSIERYRNDKFPVTKLTMLGAKTTAKDRWRQVLEEADKIKRKHLITLEGAITENQTHEMMSRNLQLVVPAEIHATYTENQQKWLFTVNDFLEEVKEKQHFDDNFVG